MNRNGKHEHRTAGKPQNVTKLIAKMVINCIEYHDCYNDYKRNLFNIFIS